MIPHRSPQARATVELLQAHVAQLEAAIRANMAHANALLAQRTDLFRMKREAFELLEEFTPVRPPSDADVRAAFVAASEFPRRSGQ